jgi:RHS repeat-associated protein
VDPETPHPETMRGCPVRPARPAFRTGHGRSRLRAALLVMAAWAVLGVGIARADSIWITDFNGDASQQPQGYRYDEGIWGQDALIDVGYDPIGTTLDIQVSFNNGPYNAGFSPYWDDYAGTGYVNATLPYSCGKVTAKVTRYYIVGAVPYHIYTSATEVFVYQGSNLACLPRRNYCGTQSGGQAAGKPCDVVDGRLWYQTGDAASSGPFGMAFNRWYDNQSTTLFNADLGEGWRHSYSANLTFPGGGLITFYSPEGLRTDFNGLTMNGIVHDMLTGADLAESAGPIYTLTTWEGAKYAFDSAGRLASITDRIGNTQSITRDGSNRIATVTDELGRTLTFAAYDASNRVTSITSTPSGIALTFTYGPGTNCPADNLCSAMMPDGKTWTYQYDGNHNLTQVTDPLGHAEEANTYDGSNRLATQSTQGGQNSLSFTYNSTSTTVRDVLSRETVYTFDPKLQIVTDILGVGCGCGGGQERSFSYDQFLRKRSETIGNDTNHQVAWAYGRDVTVNHSGFIELVAAYPSPTSKTEHLSAGVDRATSWSYYAASDARRDLVNVETRPSVDTPANTCTTTFTYSTNGLLTSRADQGYINGVSTTYTTYYTYDANGRGRIATVDGPRTDVTDVTTYAYYSDSDTDLARRGQLNTVTDAAGNVTTYAGAAAPYNTYDLFGNPFSVTDPNGVVTTMTYDGRGRVTARTLKGVTGDATDLVTSYQYDDAGKLTKVTLPRSNGTSYAYDGSNRLTDTIRFGTDAKLVERVHLVYDAMSQKTEEDTDACTTPATTCSTWSTKRKDNFAYDSYGRLATITHPGGTSITYAYDAFGNLYSVQDERHSAANTIYGYDYANRLLTVTQKRTIVPGTDVLTSYTYDKHDNLASVTDPNTNGTTHAWDDFRRMKSQSSPVSGTTSYAYDAAGNLTSSTDANTATTGRTYDALNRLLTASSARASANESVTFAYDDLDPDYFGRGRLARMTDPSGSTSYKYERHGLLRREEKLVGTTPYVTSYTYDANANRASMTYPSGRLVNFTYDVADRPISEASSSTTYVSSTGTAYQPFGPISNIGLGSNGMTWSMTFNQRYLPTSLTTTNTNEAVSYTYATDNAGNITAITDGTPAYSRTALGYDDLNRLTTATTNNPSLWGNGNHVYDKMGNLTSMTLGTTTRTFTYSGTTPKLVSVTEPAPIGTRSVSYDAAGNETGIASATYTYSPRNLLASGDGLAYTYDGRGVRTTETQLGMAIATLSPSSAPVQPSGGTTVIPITINGSGFTTSSSASFNGVSKPTTYVSSTQLTMNITYNDIMTANTDAVTVTDPARPPATAPFVVEFLDVPSQPTKYWAYDFINLMAYHGVTAGCGGGNYCPTTVVTRDQMAVFLLKAEHGSSYAPPTCVPGVPFADITCTTGYDPWIEQFGNEHISDGCGGGNYCPTSPVDRQSMAVFLLKARERDGSGYTYIPPPCTGVFNDVPCPSAYADWIEEVYRRGITAGCGGGNFCPTTQVARDQMAVFISKTWGYLTPTASATRRNFIYDQAMHLIAESSLSSTFDPGIAYEHLWLGDRPVAEEDVSGGQTFWTITDHLGTPFMETFAARTTAWRIESEPYGWVYSLRSGSDRHQPLRFPGQEAEQLNQGNNGATEKRFNIFRWYHPKWGRYSQGDPIGLSGSMNLFAYAEGAPSRLTDPLGLRHFGLGGTVVNFSDCCVLVSDNDNVPGGRGQQQKWIPPKSWSGSEDVDTIYFKNGSAIKIPDWSVYLIYDCNALAAPPTGILGRPLLSNIPNPWYRTKVLPDRKSQEDEFQGPILPATPNCRCQ